MVYVIHEKAERLPTTILIKTLKKGDCCDHFSCVNLYFIFEIFFHK